MTGILKIFTLILWFLILGIWIGDLWLGIPADVADEVTEGNVQPMPDAINRMIHEKRLKSSLFLIPAAAVFSLILYSILKRNNRLFYWGMLVTLFPILVLALVCLANNSEMPLHKVACSILLIIVLSWMFIGFNELIRVHKRSKAIGVMKY